MYIAISLKTKFKRHLPGESHDCSWVFWSWHCSRKGARRAEERKKKEENEDDETRFSIERLRSLPFLATRQIIQSPSALALHFLYVGDRVCCLRDGVRRLNR